jgi:hypothetical protein
MFRSGTGCFVAVDAPGQWRDGSRVITERLFPGRLPVETDRCAPRTSSLWWGGMDFLFAPREGVGVVALASAGESRRRER